MALAKEIQLGERVYPALPWYKDDCALSAISAVIGLTIIGREGLIVPMYDGIRVMHITHDETGQQPLELVARLSHVDPADREDVSRPLVSALSVRAVYTNASEQEVVFRIDGAFFRNSWGREPLGESLIESGLLTVNRAGILHLVSTEPSFIEHDFVHPTEFVRESTIDYGFYI